MGSIKMSSWARFSGLSLFAGLPQILVRLQMFRMKDTCNTPHAASISFCCAAANWLASWHTVRQHNSSPVLCASCCQQLAVGQLLPEVHVFDRFVAGGRCDSLSPSACRLWGSFLHTCVTQPAGIVVCVGRFSNLTRTLVTVIRAGCCVCIRRRVCGHHHAYWVPHSFRLLL